MGDEPAIKMLRFSLDTFSEPDQKAPAGTDGEADGQSHRRGINTRTVGKFTSPPIAALAPLLPREGLDPRLIARVDRAARNYLAVILGGERPAGRLYRDDELTTLAFMWHRSRSAHAAEDALEAERQMIGPEFDPDVLTSRASMWVILTEVSSLLGLWHPQRDAATAAAGIGSGLRSAYWLWLEDDDRSMSVLRCVLEQAARLRTWRTKPAKAADLESRTQTTPRDWLEAAGWRRLSALNRALGEFAHTKATSRWDGARDLLAKLQIEAEPETAIFVARGASLDFVAQLVAAEVHAGMVGISPTVANAVGEIFAKVGLEAALDPSTLEERFNHIWNLRREGLGDSIFVGPAAQPFGRSA